jgi:hypothetical protein
MQLRVSRCIKVSLQASSAVDVQRLRLDQRQTEGGRHFRTSQE